MANAPGSEAAKKVHQKLIEEVKWSKYKEPKASVNFV
jgi:fumarylacetoacetate (FAA) hydrolase family protein